MQVVHTIEAVRSVVGAWREDGHEVALVPTMGNLHDGHLSLVEAAARASDRVVVSIFVNPTQFGPGEDFEAYPRTLEADCERLAGSACDLVFAPSVAEVYPEGLDGLTVVSVPVVSDGLCGAVRPGHFQGVATVVAKLFGMVRPDRAVFGKKDYQQYQVIRKMVEDLNLPVSVLAAETVREPDGLAMSSRNRYLDPQQRLQAPALYAGLLAVREALQSGRAIHEALATGRERMAAAGLVPEYLEVRAARNLGPARQEDPEWVVLGAVRVGRARLIDNLEIRLNVA